MHAQSISAWGGEDDETPVYGVVKIAIKAASGSTLNKRNKKFYNNKINAL